MVVACSVGAEEEGGAGGVRRGPSAKALPGRANSEAKAAAGSFWRNSAARALLCGWRGGGEEA